VHRGPLLGQGADARGRLRAAGARQDQPRDGVRGQRLRAEADGDAADAADRQQRLDVEPEGVQPAAPRAPPRVIAARTLSVKVDPTLLRERFCVATAGVPTSLAPMRAL